MEKIRKSSVLSTELYHRRIHDNINTNFISSLEIWEKIIYKHVRMGQTLLI